MMRGDDDEEMKMRGDLYYLDSNKNKTPFYVWC